MRRLARSLSIGCVGPRVNKAPSGAVLRARMPSTDPIIPVAPIVEPAGAPDSPTSTDVTEAPPPVMLFLPANVMQALGVRAEKARMTASAVVCEALLKLGTTRLVELVREAPEPSVSKKLQFALQLTPPAHTVLHDTAARVDASLSRIVQLSLVAASTSTPPPPL